MFDTTKAGALQGVWGAIAPADERRGLAQALVAELSSGLAVLSKVAPAITFFGGARIKPGDPVYAAAERMGELLAEQNIPPRTGAGPGIMTAVPVGFRRRLKELQGEVPGEAHLPLPADDEPVQSLTQGFNIKLPFEQSVNPAIDIALELGHFPTRKLMLYENALGIVIFPGGLGTLDELFEVWRLKIAGNLSDPFVLYDSSFWGPLAEALRASTLKGKRLTVPKDAFALLSLADTPEEAIAAVTHQKSPRGFEEPPEELGSRIAHELVEGLEYLERLPPAVTVLGGSRLEDDDPAVIAVQEVARRLAMEGVPTRAGGPGPFSVALAKGGHRGAKLLAQQAFGMRRDDARNLYGADRVHLVNDRLTHKVLLSEGSRAVVALPGGLGTLDELFSVICQLQTRKIPDRPVVLIGADFWTPIFAALKRQMFDGPRKVIGEHDLEIVRITDDPAEAARLCLTPKPPRPPLTAR